MIKLAIEAGVSPLKVNQGVCFFASYVVADKPRLRKLLSGGCADLKNELEGVRGFLPSDWLTGEVSDEQKWQRSFAASRDRLGELAD
jgi:hypothetical protein